MTNLTSALKLLEQERNRLSSRIEQLNNAVSALTGASSTRRGKISATGRARIAAAQRARWAKAMGQKVITIAYKKRRKLSAVAIARIRAAQKARWAKWRKA
jgi:predicted  nucleic acid-binding Zn-ribbon protein